MSDQQTMELVQQEVVSGNKDKKIIAFNITLILLAIIVVVLWAYLINEYIKL